MSDKTLPALPPLTAAPDESKSVDRRKHFDELSANKASNQEEELAFLANKVDMIRNDLNLSDTARQRAVSELQKRIESLRQANIEKGAGEIK